MYEELLNGEIFSSRAGGKAVIEGWRQRGHTRRPHSSLGCKPPAPAAIVPPSNMAEKPSLQEIAAAPLNRGRTGPLDKEVSW
ncbi:integrase core domain-containing protein [Bosea sp. RAF48]|uniref:integrase core domain-containing protein n=1 Tax=Bosea sp. RAF48 TaxID=3237480 RepID=UPI003F8E27EB